VLISRLVTYCADDQPTPTLRVWRTGTAGFFSGLLGLNQGAAAVFPLPVLGGPGGAARLSFESVLQHVRLRWLSETQVALTREDRSEVRCAVDP
jgi:hypothetical protein